MPTSPGTDRRADHPAADHGTGAAEQAVDRIHEEPARARHDAEPAAERSRDEELADLRDQLSRCEQRQLRARADLDNYRKRTERDAGRQLAAARTAVLLNWLPAVDSVERALRMEPGDAGLTAVLEQMQAILTRYGVVGIEAAGERFDPQRHEALVTRPALEVPGHTVLEVLRSGFELSDGTVLRPAQVVVSQRPEGEF